MARQTEGIPIKGPAKSDSEHGIIAFGSEEHASLLGILGTDDPAEAAKREKALTTLPVINKNLRQPLIRQALTLAQGEEMRDGWSRKGR